jgi:hypothetical protein
MLIAEGEKQKLRKQKAEMKLQDNETERSRNMGNTRKANYARPPHRPCYGGWRGRENRRFGYTSQPSPETSLADALETLKPLEPRL